LTASDDSCPLKTNNNHGKPGGVEGVHKRIQRGALKTWREDDSQQVSGANGGGRTPFAIAVGRRQPQLHLSKKLSEGSNQAYKPSQI